MIYYKTLINIRKAHGYSQAEFAKLMRCDLEYLIKLENDELKPTYLFVEKLRHKLNLNDAPITSTEWETLMKGLTTFRLALDYDDMNTATRLKPKLEKEAMSSFSRNAEILYSLYAAGYYWAVNDMEAHDRTMATLSQRTDEFNARHQYYYHRLIGAREYILHNYDNALKAFLTAEKLATELQWVNVGLYYACAKCLADMGYIARAVDYYKKAQHYGRWHKPYDGKPNGMYDAYIDGRLASCLSKLGKSNEAITILEKRLSKELRQHISRENIGFTYLSFGKVYSHIGSYKIALENFEKAFLYLEEGGEAYTANLYKMAETLIASDRISEAIICLDKGLSLPDMRKIWVLLFNMLKHSTSLSEPDSILYVIDAIPKLKAYGQYGDIAIYYKLISDFCRDNENNELIVKHSNLAHIAYEIQQQHLLAGYHIQ